MLTTSPLGGNNDPSSAAFSFHRGVFLRVVRLDCVRHHHAQHSPRDGALWRLLLCHVYGRADRGGLGDVDTKTLDSFSSRSRVAAFFLYPEAQRGIAMELPGSSG